jgi:carbamoyl-phosphate synthase large subunit
VPLNVLITAGSRRVPLVRAFQEAIGRLTPGGLVAVTDVNELSPSIYVADRAYQVPLSTDPAYLDAIESVCLRDRIRLVVPTIDDELTLFAKAAPRFAKRGIRVVVSPASTTAICDDKYETCRALRDAGVPSVETYLPGALPASLTFPVFIKPRVGRGGVGAFAVRDQRELDFFLGYVSTPVIQRFLDGPEYTIDLLCNFDGRPLSVVPRERVLIRAGVVDRGRTVNDPRLIGIGLACARALPFAGPVNIQCRMLDGQPVVFEINPRFSGGIPLTIAAGADFPKWIAELTLGRTVSASIGNFKEDFWMTNYEASIFMPHDAIGFSTVRRHGRSREVA